ncbi:MAG: LysR family transcriptional regulator [Ilumatobacter sp.]|uniref:LysR family transcriptional regulator n=1 Tax=Ilumatobacter sp. TaxID=1967498 RepID=UPI003C7126A8
MTASWANGSDSNAVASSGVSGPPCCRSVSIGQPAVSRQIARLEQSLGTSLFHRTRSSAELTSAGRTLHSATRAGFSLISDAIDEVGERPGDRVVVDVSTSFATLWLLEHLDEFVTAHPEVDVRVSTRHENLSASADADVSVVFATQADAPERAVCVMPERLVVICASTASVGPDLRSERLLGLDLPLHRADWSIVLGDPPTSTSGTPATPCTCKRSWQATVSASGGANSCSAGSTTARSLS